MSVWDDIVVGAQNVAGLLGGDPNSATAQAEASLGSGAGLGGLSGLGGITATLAAFFADVTSIAMWRSLGWLALGILMMAAGVYLWLKA
jgi:hypothetical protein